MYNRIKGSMDGSPLVNLAAFIIILAGVMYAKSILTPILLALFVSIICAQPISWLEKKKVPRGVALIIVLLGMIILFMAFGFVIGGAISSFSGNLSKYEASLTTISHDFIDSMNDRGWKIQSDQLSNLIQPGKILEYTATVLNTLVNMVGTTFLIFLIVIFILLEFGSFSIKAKAVRSESNKTIPYFSTISQNIRHYLAIKTSLCIAVGVLIYIALLIIGVDYPLLWALIAGLMNYIPNIGSILATIPTAIFALVQLGPGGALWTLIASLIVHNILGNFIEPRIMGKGLGLSTLVVFLSLLFWGFVFGLVGMFLSVPFTMTIKIILEQNEKTNWIAVLLGTPSDAKAYLLKREREKRKEERINKE
jgi:AI-2 transport protein TqsA